MYFNRKLILVYDGDGNLRSLCCLCRIRLCVRQVLICHRVDITVTYLCVVSCSVEIKIVLTLRDFVIYVEQERQNTAA